MRGVAGVVPVYAEDDAEADGVFDDRPYELATRPCLQEDVAGIVSEAVAPVLRWPDPDQRSGYCSRTP